MFNPKKQSTARNISTILILFLVLVLITACSSSSSQTSPTTPDTSADNTACVPAENERVEALVIGITDGDTITVMIDGSEYKLRYIGIDTPEIGDPGYSEAADRNSQLVAGQTVTLVKDVSETDDFGRLLRYVFVDGVFVNYALAREGYAEAGSWLPDTACYQIFVEAEEQARSEGLELWTPADSSSTPLAVTTNGASACPNGCTAEQAGCAIKGNINLEGVKIYHLPDGENYEDTIIDPDKGERWFCSEDEALANGWRKANH